MLAAVPARSGSSRPTTKEQPVAEAQAPAGSGRRTNRMALVGIGFVVAAVVAFFMFNFVNGSAGKVFFSTGPRDEAGRTCTFASPIETASTSDDIYVLASFNETVRKGETFSVEVFHDGASQFRTDLTAGADFNCYTEPSPMGWNEAGVWRVVFTYQGRVQAEGSLTVIYAD
jgi:hypothetical protein